MDYLPLTLLGGLLALDGTAMGQFMVSRPLVAGVLAGWVVGDPVLGLLIGGIMEVYFISIFPVGGAEFPEGGPPALVAVATGVAVAGPAGLAIGVGVGLLLSRFGALSTKIFRRMNGRIVPDPSRMEVTQSRVVWAHLACLALDFVRGCLLSVLGLWVGSWLAAAPMGIWPLRWPGTVALLAIGATIPAGALVGSLGGWRKRGKLFGAGLTLFLLVSLVLG